MIHLIVGEMDKYNAPSHKKIPAINAGKNMDIEVGLLYLKML